LVGIYEGQTCPAVLGRGIGDFGAWLGQVRLGLVRLGITQTVILQTGMCKIPVRQKVFGEMSICQKIFRQSF